MELMALSVHKARLDLLVLSVQRVQMAPTELMAPSAPKVRWDRQVQLAPLAPTELMAQLDRKVRRDQSVLLVLSVLQGRTESMARSALKVQPAQLVPLARTAPTAPSDRRVQQESQVPLVRLVRLVQPG